MDIEKLLEELYSHSLTNIKLGLENIKRLCLELGNPQDDYKIIHIAGTNGKGSTSTTVETILLEAGYKVGKYTSPHILKFNERIRANGEDIKDSEIVHYYKLVKEIMDRCGIKATFFEITTAMMFKYFSDLKLDYVVLETGLGGRFDATNICKSDICVITNVSFDHTQFLGNTIYEIAREKAGIIKENNKSLIVADSNQDFLRAIKEKNVSIINVLEKYKNSTYELDFNKFITKIFMDNESFEFSLFGDYQYKNFLTAYEVAKNLGIGDNIIKSAVEKVVWQCRFEKFSESPLVILDGAHNVAGAVELAKSIKNGYTPDEVVVIASILKDKDVEEIVEILQSMSKNIILTSLEENTRGSSGQEIFDKARCKSYLLVEEDIKNAYHRALDMGKKVIVVCGSFYTLSKFKEEIDEKKEKKI